MDEIDDLMRAALEAITPAERQSARQRVTDALDKAGFRPTGWIDPPILE